MIATVLLLASFVLAVTTAYGYFFEYGKLVSSGMITANEGKLAKLDDGYPTLPTPKVTSTTYFVKVDSLPNDQARLSLKFKHIHEGKLVQVSKTQQIIDLGRDRSVAVASELSSHDYSNVEMNKLIVKVEAL